MAYTWDQAFNAISNQYLRRIYKDGVFSIIYFDDGPWAIDSTNSTGNGIPDYVYNTAVQLNAARYVFNTLFGWPDPLKSAVRWSSDNIPSVVEVILTGKYYEGDTVYASNGSTNTATDISFDYGETRLRIWVNNELGLVKNIGNATPAHEYFHLCQYSITIFGNVYLMEGTARWSQDCIQKSVYSYNPLYDWSKGPDICPNYHSRGTNGVFCTNPDELYNLLSDSTFQAYVEDSGSNTNPGNGNPYSDAWYLWYPFAYLIRNEKVDTINLDSVRNFKYANGELVFNDSVIHGMSGMLRFWQKLHSMESTVRTSLGYFSSRSKYNNPYIRKCIIESLDEANA